MSINDLNTRMYNNGNEFLHNNIDYLNQNKYLSNFILLDAPLLTNTDKNNYAIEVTLNSERLVLLSVKPYPALLYGDISLVKELVKYLKANDLEYDRFLSENKLGDEFSIQNRVIRGYCFEKNLPLEFMEAKETTNDSSNVVIKATIDDVDTIYSYCKDFALECNINLDINRKHVENNISSYRVIKCNDLIVSMCQIENNQNDSKRITFVYTLDNYRNKGYASKIVNYAKNEIISGNEKATLFVDETNPISKHIYSKIGFKTLFSQSEYHLVKKIKIKKRKINIKMKKCNLTGEDIDMLYDNNMTRRKPNVCDNHQDGA